MLNVASEMFASVAAAQARLEKLKFIAKFSTLDAGQRHAVDSGIMETANWIKENTEAN